MKHAYRVLAIAVSVVVAAVPLALADPAVKDYVSSHTWTAAYFPIVSGIVYAVYRAWLERSSATAPRPPAG